MRDRHLVQVLHFDGTLAPISAEPSEVVLSSHARDVLQQLSGLCPVAILSGRDLQDVCHRVRLDDLWYAGSHGFEMAGPDGAVFTQDVREPAVLSLGEDEQLLREELKTSPGARIDRKRFALAMHFRNVRAGSTDEVLSVIERIGRGFPALRLAHGRQVIELLPDVGWNKRRALRWLLQRMGSAGLGAVPVFAGDDYTDEDALHEIHEDGIGIVVGSTEHGDRLTWAHYGVADPTSLTALLSRLSSLTHQASPGSPEVSSAVAVHVRVEGHIAYFWRRPTPTRSVHSPFTRVGTTGNWILDDRGPCHIRPVSPSSKPLKMNRTGDHTLTRSPST